MRILFLDEYLPQEMLGIMWLSRALKDAGHETKALFVPDREWLDKVKAYDPDIICYSVTTGMQVYLAELNQKVRRVVPRAISVFGGPHPTFVPEYIESEGIDVVCRGEGEGAIVELANTLQSGGSINEIQNLWVKDRATGEIFRNPVRPLENDIDSLGFPDRDVIYEAAPIYRDSDRKVFVSQRGCPMNCSFCFHHAWKKKVYDSRNREYVRKRTVDHLIAELVDVKSRYNLKFVHFVDDIFNLRTDWLEDFCERYPKEVGLPFDVILMANMTTEKHIELLRKAGCVYARIAIEAASDHMRNAIFRKNTTRQQLIDAAGWIRAHGIRLGSLNILGGPGGTIEDELDTVRLNIECKVDHPLVSILQPYPEFDIEGITKGLGYTVAAYEDFPINYRRTATIITAERHKIENLHKLFPIIIRNPWMMRFVPRLIATKRLYYLYLVIFMLHAEYMVAEQSSLYANAQGLGGPRYWTSVDFLYRLSTKGVLRLYQAVFARFLHRFAATQKRIEVSLQMGDERVVAHMD